MWSYIARRLLLMIPMIFVISLINFLIVNAAPAPKGSNVGEKGDFDSSKSVEANASEFIFRRTFNLDKPVLFNTRYSLADEEILWLLAGPQRPWEPPGDRRKALQVLDDYGRTIVPHVLRIGKMARDDDLRGLRSDYGRRWVRGRKRWLDAGRPPGLEWPPPTEAPPFDEAFRTRLVELALSRLAANAPRRPKALFGDQATDEVIAFNRQVRDEQIELRRIYLDDRKSPTQKLTEWSAWAGRQGGEWDYSLGDKADMFFLETRFAKFWSNLIRFDLGSSFIHKKKVSDLIVERLPVSLTLSLGSLILAYLISVPLGILSAVKHRSVGDVLTSLSLFIAYSIPTIFLGLLLVRYLAIETGWFPVAGFNSSEYGSLTTLDKIGDRLHHLALPMATLTLGSLAYYSRYMKSGMIEIIHADFVRTARAKGLSEFVVVVKHAARNGLIPIITLLGSSLPVVIGGSIIVEVIFEVDGMGKFGYEAVVARDYAVIMGINILVAALTLVGVFLADLAYAFVDPRISYR